MFEREFQEEVRERTREAFVDKIRKYDDSQVRVMLSQGWEIVSFCERTMSFTFGTITFERRRYKKGNNYIYPVDKHFDFKRNIHFSPELLFKISELACTNSYRQVVGIVERLYGVYISTYAVVKALKQAGELIDDRSEYRYLEDFKNERKIESNIVYIEGDGVMLRTSDLAEEHIHSDYAHFIVHTGSKQVSKNRRKLQNKKEFIGKKPSDAREELVNYIYNNFEITEKTLLITNSDGGKGYTPYIFREIASDLGFQHHEHFWDRFHVNELILQATRKLPTEETQDTLRASFFAAIQAHDKKKFRCSCDTLEAFLKTEEELKQFDAFKRRFLKNFQYTKPADQRGLRTSGIGIIESNHRKITYRMKKRGMYWSVRGALVLAKTILLFRENKLEELFFGEWQKECYKMKSYDHDMRNWGIRRNRKKSSRLDRKVGHRTLGQALKRC